ncbi:MULTISPECIES: hypothetical protein [unclassified Cellulomonas]|uniref:hypothetical protein n=1 Tax=unclassified Cellulomonas TaxID=2620175 RepID=UPI001997FEF4|nr:hypothetical protein [Cellulomonas sp. ES6]MBD3780627.1 hypothetical protein [Micrococcales bacterium]WHP19318.1 hypothetical protein P9841_09610 [Cellulomonas sp. ES6]
MLTETDPRAAAFVNLHAVLGALPELVRRVPAARELLTVDPRPVSVVFAVRGGPRAALAFRDGAVQVVPDRTVGTILLPFASPEAFNRVVAGEAQPVPVTGLHRIGFLLRVFTPLTELLGRYLRPAPEDLADPAFRETSTALTLHVAVAAAAQLANEDRAGRFSAHHTVDGDVALEVTGSLAYTLRVRDHRMTFVPEPSPRPRAALTFADLDTAGALLAGKVSALACLGDGRMAMRGHVAMVDNVNRILDRVGQYLGE